MTPEEFAGRVHRRHAGDKAGIDPMTILAIITAVVQLGKLVVECYRDWKKDEVVAAYHARGPLGWLRRRRVSRALAAANLDPAFAPAVVDEVSALSQSEFLSLVNQARAAGGY